MTAAAAARLVSADEIRAAAARLRGVAIETPLLPAPELGDELGCELRLKCENLQRAGAFKIRGAYNLLSQLDLGERARGVVAFSSGNHAQGVALAARLLGIRATVVLPVTAPAVKREGAARLGAEVVLEGYTSLDRKRRAEEIAAERGAVIVPGFDDARIIAGQGTAGLEIVSAWPEVDTVVVQVGGGGLISGIAVAVREALPHARIIGVEPALAPSMTAALEAGQPVTIPRSATIADGLAAVRVSDLTLAHARALVDQVVTVTEDALREAAAWLLTRRKLVVEFSGAAPVAALRSGLIDTAGRRVAAVLSGGNIEPAVLCELLAA